MLNIVVPMAGLGSRFAKEGYTLPKPLIPVRGQTMIEVVVKNITPKIPAQFIFITQEEHIRKYNLDKLLQALAPGCVVIPITEITEGACSTVLLAREYIDNSHPLMIANSDQFVDADINNYLQQLEEVDGLVMTFWSNEPKWSYCLFEGEYVSKIVEKQVVSNEATVGIYNFKHGADFVRAADSMIKKGERVNGEFYVAPTYNELILDGGKVKVYNIGDGMHGLGTPEDLKSFLLEYEHFK